MAFEHVPAGPEPIAPGLIERMSLDIMSLVQLAVLAVVGLVLGLFVIRPILGSAPKDLAAALPAPAGALTGEIAAAEAAPAGASAIPATPAAAPLQIDATAVPETRSDPVSRLRDMIEDRQTETVEVLRNWMETEQDGAR